MTAGLADLHLPSCILLHFLHFIFIILFPKNDEEGWDLKGLEFLLIDVKSLSVRVVSIEH